MNQSTASHRFYYARSYAVALWLTARGFEPLGAEMARDGSAVLFLFERDGIDAVLPEFHLTKDKLNRMSTAARVPVVR